MTTASPIDLITVQQIADYFGGTPNAPQQKEQDAIQRLITSASAIWLWKTGRSPNGIIPVTSPFIDLVAYDQNFDGNGNDRQFVPDWPIGSVQGVTINTQAVPQSVSVGQYGWVVDRTLKSIVLRGGGGSSSSGLLTVGFNTVIGGGLGRGRGPVFTYGTQNVRLQYMGGFAAVPVPNELQTIPATPGPYQIKVAQRWVADAGVVFFSSGTPLVKVGVAPSTGQYYLNGAGNYLFAAADQGRQVLISYTSPGTPPDIIDKCTVMVATNYKRRQWLDVKSLGNNVSGASSTTTYRDWDISPEIMDVMNFYRRNALV